MTKHYPNAAEAGFDWFKSSYSSGEQSCVEVAITPGTVPVRDSKNPHGPALALTPTAWTTFITHTKTQMPLGEPVTPTPTPPATEAARARSSVHGGAGSPVRRRTTAPHRRA
ncbi:MAG TPA: DUF397 domain-containing protein [Pseudonocardiaceae bacterium]|nr:DUF397 domain-containing protein [Pseudonocardiaceae bacterium]